MKAAPRKPQTQNIFHFCRFWSPKFPRKHQSTPKKNSLLPLFALIRCPFDLVSAGGVWKQGRMKARLIYSEHTKRATPPPICGATSALYPHNFSHHKNRKKFACPWVEKISEKICRRMFRGKREAPNLVERGRGAKIRKSVFVGKDS